LQNSLCCCKIPRKFDAYARSM